MPREVRRSHCTAAASRLLVAGLGVLLGCSSIGPVRIFAPISDHQTTEPRSLAERGFAPLATPPPAVGWELAVVAIPGGRRSAAFELRGTFRQNGETSATDGLLEPLFLGAEIVDDEGRRFPCVRARIPLEGETGSEPSEPGLTREYAWVFEVSGSYDFARVQFVAVHWGFLLAGQHREITSRFRVA